MSRCNAALLADYPRLHIYGESSVNNVVDQTYCTRNKIDFPFKSNQPGGLDFVLEDGFLAALKEVGTPAITGWDGGPQHLYQALAQDALYENPNRLVTFLDNFDHNRFLSEIGDDLDKYKMALTWLLTTRGIPSMYYGTEILMKNFRDPTDAEVRRDFPGGWPGDKEDKFTPAGRLARENEAFDFVKKLATYRRDHPALHSGKLMQYLPENGLYVYFRYEANGTVLVASNTTDKPASLPTARFAERMAGFSKARNVLTGESLNSLATLPLPAKTAVVLELLK